MTTELNKEALLPCPGDVGAWRQRLANVNSPQMRGDNLAILLASYIEAGIEDDELDESGTWKQGAIDFANEVLDAIHSHYTDALTAQASRIKELEGERDDWRNAAFLSDCEAHSGQLDEMTTRAERAERERDAAHQDAYYHCLNASNLMERNNAVEALLEQAKAALEPFAAYTTADGIDGTDFLRIPDNHPILFNGLGDEAEAVVLIKHFRAARSTLTAISSKGGSGAE